MAKKISVSSWTEIFNILKKNIEKESKINGKNIIDIDSLNIFNKISDILDKQRKNYVYTVELEFGDLVINKGAFAIENFEIDSKNEYNKKKKDFINDISYTKDPFGLVIENQIQAYAKNKYIFSNAPKSSYLVPLNIIKTGQLFGSFGTANYITNINKNNFNDDWFVVAGSISYSLAFIFHLDGYIDEFDQEIWEIFNPEDNKTIVNEVQKINFFKRFYPDWRAKIVYFPKHFFENSDFSEILNLEIKNKILETSWVQAASVVYSMFDNKYLSDIIYNRKLGTLSHKKEFLNIIYNYLLKASRGESFVMKPIVSKDNFLNKALTKFKDSNEKFFEKKGSPLPFIFDFDYLNGLNDWGLVSLCYLPILHNYEIKSPSGLIKDLNKIQNKIENNDYKLKDLKIYGRTGNKPSSLINSREELIEQYLLKSFNINYSNKINLTSKELKSLFLIKKK